MGQQRRDKTSILEDRVICPNCKHENEASSLVCKHCGRLLERRDDPEETHPVLPKAVKESLGATGEIQSGKSRFGADDTLVIHVRDSNTPINLRVGDELIVGRYDPDKKIFPDLDLSLYDALDKGVSRRHVAIRRRGDVLNLVDLGTPNGTFLNGQRLMPLQFYPLRDGDELRLGRLVMQVYFRLRT